VLCPDCRPTGNCFSPVHPTQNLCHSEPLLAKNLKSQSTT
jgi:hypothetical protein